MSRLQDQIMEEWAEVFWGPRPKKPQYLMLTHEELDQQRKESEAKGRKEEMERWKRLTGHVAFA